ncbi:MAG TPA: hypothetical protein VEW25_07785 [Allosphingosinicella sp.]|nr:hypothetical protein [Allosphingosinicella sp.]
MSRKPRFASRLVIGAIAGFVGTMTMTAAMRRLHRRLPKAERYPLTPREIVDSVGDQLHVPLGGETAKDVTTAAHFLYGAAMGALISALNPDTSKRGGALAGAAVWLASYMGWIPAVGTLEPATKHPARRNALMIGVHLVWGSTTAAAIRELRLARETIFADGEDRDAPRPAPSSRRRPGSQGEGAGGNGARHIRLCHLDLRSRPSPG